MQALLLWWEHLKSTIAKGLLGLVSLFTIIKMGIYPTKHKPWLGEPLSLQKVQGKKRKKKKSTGGTLQKAPMGLSEKPKAGTSAQSAKLKRPASATSMLVKTAGPTFVKPVKNARISSGFGWRKHPVLKRRILHKGMDLAAKEGTPILAAADGTIVHARYSKSYGNWVKIAHKNSHETSYAHMASYPKSLKKGTKVKRGQCIGYVGKTGRCTGPHLHFEVIKNGKHVNPKTYLV